LGCTVSELGARISAEEFTEACVYLREEPLDPALLSALAEMLAALANGPLTKRDKTLWSAADFLATRWQLPQQDQAEAQTAASSGPTAAQMRAMFAPPRR